MSDGPVTSAIAGIIDRSGPFALVLRRFDTDRDYPSHWCFPGGRLRPGETSPEAAAREVLEETGLTVVGLQGVGTRVSVGATGRTDRIDCFLTESWSGALIRFPSAEHASGGWVPVDQLAGLAPVGSTTRWLITAIRARCGGPTEDPSAGRRPLEPPGPGA